MNEIDKTQREEDYINIRKDIMEVLEKSKTVIMDFADMALSAQNHNAYKSYGEVLDNYMKNVDKLIQLDKSMAELEKVEISKEENNVINNTQQNTFVGSTRDMLSMLKKAKKEMDKFEDEERKMIEASSTIPIENLDVEYTETTQVIKQKED